MNAALSRFGVWLMPLFAKLPLPWLRRLGAVLGRMLYHVARSRRRVVEKNLALCFPHWSHVEIRAHAQEIFRLFAVSFLDRSWLWSAPQQVVTSRLNIRGDVQALRNESPLVVFAPHFFGLDAGGSAIMANALRPLCSIYTPQTNGVVDAWIMQGRSRFDAPVLLSRYVSPREIAQQVQAGRLLYLLPDMDFGRNGAYFVPFFGVNAATIASLSRFAKLAKARVLTVMALVTDEGYDVHVSSPWQDFPSRDPEQDAARMNRELEALIRQHPTQYYWVHKRFKTRPEGEAQIY